MLHAWGLSIFVIFGDIGFIENLYETFMPSHSIASMPTHSIASMPPQENTEHTILYPALKRYLHLLEDLAYSLEVVTYVKKPKISL